MGKTYLLDCTLRDGGYVNDWRFGYENIKKVISKLNQTGIDMIEVGFIKGDSYDKEKSLFPDTKFISSIIKIKKKNISYVGMLDMSTPVKLSKITKRNNNTIDGIRVIFKKDKMNEAYEYCKHIKKMGYDLFVNFVSTDLYTDDEFISGIKKFNALDPFGMTIVDTFGLIKRKQFLRLVYLADNNLKDNIALCYHAHNNLQQAFGNAEALVELNLKRPIVIDGCVFGMGRGAGNLNIELFADYMNENHETSYKIEPMLEIMDECLSDIYKQNYWGYSLPLYLSARTNCHPNYAIYLSKRDTLNSKAFYELLDSISKEDKEKFSKDKADEYYKKYQECHYDDAKDIAKLKKELGNRNVLILAPGKSTNKYLKEIKKLVKEKNAIVICTNYLDTRIKPDFVFSANMRRYSRIVKKSNIKYIVTSNMRNELSNYVVDFSTYAPKDAEIIDNSGIMLLNILFRIQPKKVFIAGMDGYPNNESISYFDEELEFDFSKDAIKRNELISKEILRINKKLNIEFITPTIYK